MTTTTRMTLDQISTATLDDAREAAARCLHEMWGPFDLHDSETNEVIREATADETVESVLSGPEGHILADGRRCYVAE